MQLKWTSAAGEQLVWATALHVEQTLTEEQRPVVLSVEHEGVYADIAFVVIAPEHTLTWEVEHKLFATLKRNCEIVLEQLEQ